MFLSKDFRRNIRRILTDKILILINNFNIPHNVVEFIIKSFHFQHITWAYISLFLLPIKLFIIIFILSVILFLLFVYLDGCVLSNIEYKLCKNKKDFINIIDPYLHILGKEINTNNRYFYTLYFSLIYLLGCIIKFVYIYSK